MHHFHELFVFGTPNDLTGTPTPRVWRLGPFFTPLTRKRGSFAALGWALGVGTSSHSRSLPDSSQNVRVCVTVLYAPVVCTRLCVYVYITTLWFFAARGRLAEIDPIPQL
jgi:hypothetical protein